MKNYLIIIILSFMTSHSYAVMKVSPYLGFGYTVIFDEGSLLSGLDISFEFKNNIEIGLGASISKTIMLDHNYEIRPNVFLNELVKTQSSPLYLIFAYNYYLNSSTSLVTYSKLGRLNTLVYNDYDYYYINEGNDIILDDTIVYGTNFVSLGIRYVYTGYFISAEYFLNFFRQDYINQNSYNNTFHYNIKNYNTHTLSFKIGYTFNSGRYHSTP